MKSESHYFQYTVGVVLYNQTKDSFFIIKRNHEPFIGRYALPGGRPGATDCTLYDTAERELNEVVRCPVILRHIDVFFDDPEWPFFVFSCPIEQDHSLDLDKGQWIKRDMLDQMEALNELAPHVYEACTLIDYEDQSNLDAKILLMRSARLAVLANYQILPRAVDVSEQGGWNHFIHNNGIGVMGTAYGLRILSCSQMIAEENQTRIRQTYIQPSIEWLKSAQRPDGGWSTLTLEQTENPKIKGLSITESTAISLLAIVESNCVSKNDTMVVKATHWLMSNQLRDGGWGVAASFSKKGRVLPTVLALEALRFFSDDLNIKSTIDLGFKWLLSAQTSKGGWGTHADGIGNSDTLAHTSRVLCLFLAKEKYQLNNKIDHSIDKAFAFLEKKLSSKGHQALLSPLEEDEWSLDPHFQLLSWWHSPVLWCLRAVSLYSKSRNKSVKHLEEYLLLHLLAWRDPQGSWMLPGKKARGEIWLLHDIVDTLKICHYPLKIRLVDNLNKDLVINLINEMFRERFQRTSIQSDYENCLQAKSNSPVSCKRLHHNKSHLIFFCIIYFIVGLFWSPLFGWVNNLSEHQPPNTYRTLIIFGITCSMIAAGFVYLIVNLWNKLLKRNRNPV